MKAWKLRFTVLSATIAAVALPLQTLPIQALTPAYAQQAEHPHIFNIYASVPEGNGKELEITAAKIAELERCGIAAIDDYTHRYLGLAPNLFIALTGPHRDLATAKAELQKAKSCGIDGYTKRATFLGGE